MTEKIISIIRQKFIENLDEGLLLRPDFEDFDLTEDEIVFYKNKFAYETDDEKGRKEITIPDKKNPYSYLTARYLRTAHTKKDHWGYDKKYWAKFDDKLHRHNTLIFWSAQTNILNSIISNAPDFISAEEIADNDLIYINVGYRSWKLENPNTYSSKANDTFWVYNKGQEYHFTKKADCKKIVARFADVFIFTTRYFIKLSLGANGVIDRTEHIIQRDIKKLNIIDNNKLEIYFHGHFDPETIVLDDYKTALQLQRHLTELRQVRTDNRSQTRMG